MMTNLTWTKTKPTLPGRYWFRIAGAIQPHIRQVGILDDQLCVLRGCELVAELGDDVEFAGPIDLPEEPVIHSERQSFAKMIAEQQEQINKKQEQIDKLIKNNNANNEDTLHVMTVDESLVISKRVVELLKKECKQMGIQYSNRPLLIAAYAAGGGSLSLHDLIACDLAFDMGKNSIK